LDSGFALRAPRNDGTGSLCRSSLRRYPGGAASGDRAASRGRQAQHIRQPVPPVEGDALATIFDWAQRHLESVATETGFGSADAMRIIFGCGSAPARRTTGLPFAYR
jgi:hypothetical protein